MEQHGNTTTYNLENVLRQNILSSDYYNKTCLKFSSVHEVIDEIYSYVDHVEPWMSGNARGPSSAFCLWHRIATLKPSVREVREMVDHKDSPFIRAVGFLLLRYTGNPAVLWQWCGPHVTDPERFTPSPEGKEVTIGDFVHDILLEQRRSR